MIIEGVVASWQKRRKRINSSQLGNLRIQSLRTGKTLGGILLYDWPTISTGSETPYASIEISFYSVDQEVNRSQLKKVISKLHFCDSKLQTIFRIL